MSLTVTSYALKVPLDPVSKLILITYADFVNDDGHCAWATAKQLAESTRRDRTTVRRHVAQLLETGWLREGNQNAISDYWKTRPPASRPVVYDIALTEETRLRWAAEYRPSAGRMAAASFGSAGGLASAAVRRDKISETPLVAEGGVMQPSAQADPGSDPASGIAQVAQGGVLQPTHGQDPEMQGGWVASDARGVGCTVMQPKTSLELPSEQPGFRSEPTASSQNGEKDTQASRAGTEPRSRRKERTPEDQVLFDQAQKIAVWWWELCKHRGPIVGTKFPGLRDNIILAALQGGATPQEVQSTLQALGDVFPSVQNFQRILHGQDAHRRSNGSRHTPYEPPQDQNLYRQPLGAA